MTSTSPIMMNKQSLYKHTSKAFLLSLAGVIMLPMSGYAFSSAISSANVTPYAYNSGSSSIITVGNETQEKFIDTMAGDAITFLADTSLTEDDKKAKFASLLSNSFDLETIGRFALGRHWRTASPAQRDEYQSLFKKMIIAVYSKRFGDYQGQKFEVTGSHGEEGSDITVESKIIPANGGQPITVEWRVRTKNGQNKIIDIIVEGVSMALTQRSEFASVIQRGGGDISVLIDHLSQFSN